MLIEKAVFPCLQTSICMLINSEDKKTSFQYEVSKGKRIPLQRKIKGNGRDIIKLPGFKSLKKKSAIFAMQIHTASFVKSSF